MRMRNIECGTYFKNYLNDRFHRIWDILANFNFRSNYTVYRLNIAGEIIPGGSTSRCERSVFPWYTSNLDMDHGKTTSIRSARGC